MTDNFLSSHDSSKQDSELILPIKKEDLGNFIYGLLGQRQSIEREFDLEFDLDHNWLVNLHELISQRIHMQASAKLINFKAVISFEKGMRRTLTTIESFESYKETKIEIPVGIKIIWNYLVQFPEKDTPEKQQITFSAEIHSSGKQKQLKEKSETLILYKFLSKQNIKERSTIRFQIDHTERTWGDDIETIISSHTDGVLRTDNKLDKIFNIARLLFAPIALISSFYFLVINVATSSSKKIGSIIENYDLAFSDKLPTTNVVDEKIDYIKDMLHALSLKDENMGTFIVIQFVVMFLLMFVLAVTERKRTSFLVLSERSKLHREKILKKEGSKKTILLLSYLLSIAGGVIANYGYSWLIGA